MITYERWREVRPQLKDMNLKLRGQIMYDARKQFTLMLARAGQTNMELLSLSIQWGMEYEEELQAFLAAQKAEMDADKWFLD